MNAVTIIGSGMAAYTLARELRKLDKSRPMAIITADDGSFYSKPMLSNAFAQGKKAEELVGQTAAQMAHQLDATLLTKTAVKNLDVGNKRVVLEGRTLEYSALILAVGARPIRLPLRGNGADGVLSINHLSDYVAFRKAVDALDRLVTVVVLGAGLIGCEFADDLSGGGHRVTLVDPSDVPLASLAPRAISEGLKLALQSRGVGLQLGTTATTVEREGDSFHITLANGQNLKADIVLSAVGLRPDIDLAKTAGLAVDRGIVVDKFAKTSAHDVYALGDCAQYTIAGEATPRALPYIAPIMLVARAIAKTLSGTPTIVEMKPMPIIVKTPSYPIAIVAPAPHQSLAGVWKTEEVEGTTICRFYDENDLHVGFALAPQDAKLRARLVAELATSSA
jgi:rubredoxin---NAD+ reductase